MALMVALGFTVLLCGVVVMTVLAPLALIGWLSIIAMHAVRRRRGAPGLPDDWWEQFERDLDAYTRADWREAREAEQNA